MRCYVRSVVQLLVVVLLLVFYLTVVAIWQTDDQRNARQHGVARDTFQERGPRSVADPELIQELRYLKSGVNGSSRSAELKDLFISIKTTKIYHQSRLDVILKTWFILAREQTYFFTDSDDDFYQSKTNYHMINTNCSTSHNRKALCCKMAVEFDSFLDSKRKWFCHFDDDNYVNIPRLVKLLRNYSAQEDWYLGKPSIRAPLEIYSKDNFQNISFWFATGGAGFCLSRALALKMMPLASGGKLISIGEKIRLPDDVTIGYIVEHLLKKTLTVIEQFHSHLEPMKFLQPENYHEQITFSYSRFGREMNVLSIQKFDDRIDPTRFLSLHCHLFPTFSFCPR